MSDLSSSVANFNQMIREISCVRLETICQQKGFLIGEILNSRRVHGHWMAQILISGPQLRLIFRVYFCSSQLKNWSKNIFQAEPEKISLLQIHDLAKEYCNLIAGHIKSSLDQNEINVGMSLPFLSRGFDCIFLFSKKTEGLFNDSWRVFLSEEDFITCTSNIEIFKDFRFTVKNNPATAGNVEFL